MLGLEVRRGVGGVSIHDDVNAADEVLARIKRLQGSARPRDDVCSANQFALGVHIACIGREAFGQTNPIVIVLRMRNRGDDVVDLLPCGQAGVVDHALALRGFGTPPSRRGSMPASRTRRSRMRQVPSINSHRSWYSPHRTMSGLVWSTNRCQART